MKESDNTDDGYENIDLDTDENLIELGSKLVSFLLH